MTEVTKVSEIEVDHLIDYIHTDDHPDTRSLLATLLRAAKAYIESHTGLTPEDIDRHPDIVVAVYILCQEWYDNRTLHVDKGTVSPTADVILNMYSVNLI